MTLGFESSLQRVGVMQLLDIMSELTPDEQRAFLRFVTGAPRLPPGGLAAVNPKLTIVRKVVLLRIVVEESQSRL